MNLTKSEVAALIARKPLPKRKRKRETYQMFIPLTDPAVRDWAQRMQNSPSAFWAHRTVPGLNERGHWSTRERRRNEEKNWGWSVAFGKIADQVRNVRFTRYGPSLLDDDNLPQCFKAIRDGIAGRFEVSDGPDGPIHWEYRQVRTARGCFGVRVEFIGETKP